MADSPRKLLSIVVPALNEASGIQKALRTIASVLEKLNYAYEIIVIDDGSRDHTFDRAASLADAGLPIRTFGFSRNFGKEAAILAGLRVARGDGVITIDADLQHPPSLIPAMVSAWEGGAKIVNGVKRDRRDRHWWITLRANLINSLLKRIGGIDVRNASDFKLLDRAVVEVMARELPERRRFYRGLTYWLGFPQVLLEFDVAPRDTGRSTWSLHALISLAWTAMVSFTAAPLQIVSVLGLFTLLLGLFIGTDTLWSWLHGRAVSGFATTIIVLLLIGSSIMISLGIIGEYIAKIYEEIKRRPAYIISRSYEKGLPLCKWQEDK